MQAVLAVVEAVTKASLELVSVLVRGLRAFRRSATGMLVVRVVIALAVRIWTGVDGGLSDGAFEGANVEVKVVSGGVVGEVGEDVIFMGDETS